MKVIVTSGNGSFPAKVAATLEAILKEKVSMETRKTESKECRSVQAAKEKVVRDIFAAEGEPDYFIGLEFVVEREFDQFYSLVFCAVAEKTKNKWGFGESAKFTLPDDISAALERGGQVGDQDFASIATGSTITLPHLISDAVTSALIPFHFFHTEIPKDAPEELVKYVGELTAVQKNCLAAQLRLLDFSPIKTVDCNKTTSELKAVDDPANYDELNDTILQNGVSALKAGEVAVLVMAGGQGSRLRAPVPKAMMEVETPLHMTLLEIQARKIKKLMTMFDAKSIPLYILTSESTHSAIAAYLIEHNNFGLPHVMLVRQRQLPARTPEGKFVLSEKWKVMAAPNGNGAIFEELKISGALEDMKRLGVKYVEIHPIDNPLARPADPFFVGAMIYEDGDAAVKVLRKRPKEKIGTLCKRNGKTIVIEYSEIPDGEEEAYKLGNTGLQCYRIDLIERASNAELPYHIACKKEKLINEAGEQVMGDVRKFERFVFDALEYAENVVLFECKREEEFAPIKNPPGSEFDSPDTARDLVIALHKKWAADVGIKFEGEGPFEFRPETTYAGEGLEHMADSVLTLPMTL